MLIGCLYVLYLLFEGVPVMSRKDLRNAYITSMFSVLWIGGESAPELGINCNKSLDSCGVHGFHCNRI